MPEHLAQGQRALAEGRWEAAREAFAAALRDDETAAALDGLADALWWLCDAPASVRHRERAFVVRRQAGDAVGAAHAALTLCIAYLVNLGNDVAARGWLARAERVSADLSPNPVQGWLWLMQGYLSGDPETARDRTGRALLHAQACGDADLELLALSDLGLELVSAGEADRGLAMLDEAMAGTLGGEGLRLDTVVFATCNMLHACQLVGDLDRAAKWCRVAEDFMRTYGCPFLYARCRAHYGGVLLATGHWAQAEAELRSALEMAVDAGPGPRDEAHALLAELRLHQGRLEEAEALLGQIDAPDDVPIAAAAARLARGEAAAAVELLRRRAAARAEREAGMAETLALLVEAQLDTGDVAGATETAERLERAAVEAGSGVVQAYAAVSSGRVASAAGDAEVAAEAFARAVADFARLDRPHEAVRARLELARCLASKQPALAVEEARRALRSFEELGATAGADDAAALLRALGVPARSGLRSGGVLTEREQEVLHLLGLGLSNPEIAARLFISRKTAAHHVSSVLAKLGVRNRTEAAARAAAAPAPPR